MQAAYEFELLGYVCRGDWQATRSAILFEQRVLEGVDEDAESENPEEWFHVHFPLY